ncbi:relaxasome subunit MobC [Nitrospirillum amazonense]|uniref:Relaxasome subunit MobC n=1 Tax=Nitrospirillum amazonense TaxID=28077 RepID=A0A560EJB3_9PROT|nr:mobilization protein [Nitrospirillum amazonense]TWB09315.1 relaxasome subunit MobC [Nitrospirillum amazonense]
MPRKSIEERLAQLDAQRKTLAARLSKRQRAQDTRRKVLLGALVLHHLQSQDDVSQPNRLRDWLRHQLPKFLTRADDKALFADILGDPPNDDANPPPTTR